MPGTTKGDVVVPEILEAAIRGAFAQRAAFAKDVLVATGALVINGTFDVSDPNKIGTEVGIPRFGVIDEFAPNPDGTSITSSRKLRQTRDVATVSRDSLTFQLSRWSESGAGNPYEETVEQTKEAFLRLVTRCTISAATAAGAILHDITGSSLGYSDLVSARGRWGDEGDNVAVMMVHSRTMIGLRSLTDASGRPLLVMPTDGSLPRLDGVPILMTDALQPDASSAMGAVTSTGTSAPGITLAGTPTGDWRLVVDILTAGTVGTATYRFSVDGGSTWSSELVTSAAAVALSDTATIDSMVGNNGSTGLTIAFTAGNHSADALYKSNANLVLQTLLIKPKSLVFWYNRAAMVLLDQPIPADDSRAEFMHCYHAETRLKRANGSTRTGVVKILHSP